MEDFYNSKVKELFGLNYLFPWQRLAIANTLEGMGYFGEGLKEKAPSKSLVVLPTGGGKSLCFMMPPLLAGGVTVILFPLLALMADQERRLKDLGESPAVFRGGQNRDEREKLWLKLQKGECHFILTNAETACGREFRERLEEIKPNHLVIDEVHTIPQWGESFRKGLLGTGELVDSGLFPLVTAYTATASPEYEESIGRLVFQNEPYHTIRANPDRSNINYHIVYTKMILPALEELCLKEKKPILIFCSTRASTESTARYLNRRIGNRNHIGEVRFYHAGLEKDEKKENEEWFIENKKGILCSTNAYGMGMNCHNLLTVIHRDIPQSMESYIQEAGRVGRNGQKARALMLVNRDKPHKLMFFTHEKSRCRREMILNAMGAEFSHCSGCDYCSPSQPIPLVEKQEKRLAILLKWYCPAFTKKEWTYFLKGYPRHEFWSLFPGFAYLKGWDRNLISEILEQEIKEGNLKLSRKGLWRNHIFIKGKRKTMKSFIRKNLHSEY